MGVYEIDEGLGYEYKPICNKCGINLCYSLSFVEYLENKDYWDNWCCLECDPNYLTRWMENQLKQLRRNKNETDS